MKLWASERCIYTLEEAENIQHRGDLNKVLNRELCIVKEVNRLKSLYVCIMPRQILPIEKQSTCITSLCSYLWLCHLWGRLFAKLLFHSSLHSMRDGTHKLIHVIEFYCVFPESSPLKGDDGGLQMSCWNGVGKLSFYATSEYKRKIAWE